MSGITGDIKKILQFKFKVRNDSATDQYNRLFMVKCLIAAAFLTGLQWYKDKIQCIVPGTSGGSVGGFSPEACWINGLYIYNELRDLKNFQGYYGIPSKLEYNGTMADGTECIANGGGYGCKPMTKVFYLQFQWLPFYIAIMAFIYYIPYLLFQYVNNDLLSLKKSIKSQEPDIDAIIKNYFNRHVNTLSRQNMKIILNVLVKVAYLLANVITFAITNSLLNGDYRSFGSQWLDWSSNSNQNAYNYVGIRKLVKPGERLLPAFAICDVFEAGLDIKHTLINQHRFICELSQHILFQYVLMAVWFLIVIGMVVSILGILLHIGGYIFRTMTFAREETAAREVYSRLSPREGEYLDFIRKKNVPLYGTLIRKLYEGDYTPPSSSSKRSSFVKDNMM